jgi:hypothetical protein
MVGGDEMTKTGGSKASEFWKPSANRKYNHRPSKYEIRIRNGAKKGVKTVK